MNFLLKKIQTSHFAEYLKQMKEILNIFKNNDFMDIIGVLRNPSLVSDYIKKCEKLENLSNEKGRKIKDKEKTITDLENDKKELGKKRRFTMTKLASIRGLIQKELEANFKARFLVVN